MASHRACSRALVGFHRAISAKPMPLRSEASGSSTDEAFGTSHRFAKCTASKSPKTIARNPHRLRGSRPFWPTDARAYRAVVMPHDRTKSQNSARRRGLGPRSYRGSSNRQVRGGAAPRGSGMGEVYEPGTIGSANVGHDDVRHRAGGFGPRRAGSAGGELRAGR